MPTANIAFILCSYTFYEALGLLFLVLHLMESVRQNSSSSEGGANEKETREKEIITATMNAKEKVKD